MATNTAAENTGIDGAEARSSAVAQSLGATLLSAVVEADGTLVRGCHATSASKGDVPVGSYVVTFDRDIRRGAYVGSVGMPGAAGISPAGTVTVVGRAGDTRAVYIAMYDEDGNRVDRAFHLIVACPEGFA